MEQETSLIPNPRPWIHHRNCTGHWEALGVLKLSRRMYPRGTPRPGPRHLIFQASAFRSCFQPIPVSVSCFAYLRSSSFFCLLPRLNQALHVFLKLHLILMRAAPSRYNIWTAGISIGRRRTGVGNSGHIDLCRARTAGGSRCGGDRGRCSDIVRRW